MDLRLKEKMNSLAMGIASLTPDEVHISSILMDQMTHGVHINGNRRRVIEMQATLEFLESMGNAEHTPDWDPFMQVEFIDQDIDTAIRTSHGYYQIDRINELTIEVQMEDNRSQIIPIKKIKRISIHR